MPLQDLVFMMILHRFRPGAIFSQRSFRLAGVTFRAPTDCPTMVSSGGYCRHDMEEADLIVRLIIWFARVSSPVRPHL
jgi:hypothetical protein